MERQQDLHVAIIEVVAKNFGKAGYYSSELDRDEFEGNFEYFDRLISRFPSEYFTEMEDDLENLLYQELDRILGQEVVIIEEEHKRRKRFGGFFGPIRAYFYDHSPDGEEAARITAAKMRQAKRERQECYTYLDILHKNAMYIAS